LHGGAPEYDEQQCRKMDLKPAAILHLFPGRVREVLFYGNDRSPSSGFSIKNVAKNYLLQVLGR
jgi:hypothetical protein